MKSNSGRKIRKNARVTMPLKSFQRAIKAAMSGKRAKIKARLS